MSKEKQTPALKPYMKAVRTHCKNLSKKELIEFVCEMAQAVSPRERADFLEKFSQFSDNASEPSPDEIKSDLPLRISDLRESIIERHEAIDDGSLYEDEDEYDRYEWGGYDYYDDHAPDSISEYQKKDIETLFAEADSLFLSDHLDDACEAYGLLLEWFHSQGESGFYYNISQNDIELNWRETRARHCRCVYETSKPGDRVEKMIHAMDVHKVVFSDRYTPSEEKHPSLRDVFDARPGKLKGWDAFLKAWTKALAGETNERAVLLFLEGVCWMKGLDGVAGEMRKRHHPIGYLYWLYQLVSEKKWKETVRVARKALERMPYGELRAQAAEFLTRAGEQTKEPASILEGKREQFCSTPHDSRLGLLIEEADRQQVKEEELESALRFLDPEVKQGKLKVKILLMLGRIDDAYKLVRKEKPLGWSSGGTSIGVFFGGVLTALTHASPEGVTIHGLLNRYVSFSGGYYFLPTVGESGKKGAKDRVLREIVQGLSNVSLTDAKKKKWFSFAENLGGKRIDAIVSNKHRQAYERAAQVLGSLMEGRLLNDDARGAKRLLNTYRNEKYNRYSAFRREVDAVLTRSEILSPFHKSK
ncbi:hypothetical protein QUF72_10655 [Desulfobacterales bacterium HSG2]|nr:hypothetical protein [Desulfobacterales bacterium HSG2]